MMAPTRHCLRCERHAPTTRNKNDHHRPDSVPPLRESRPIDDPFQMSDPASSTASPARAGRVPDSATTRDGDDDDDDDDGDDDGDETRWTTRGADARGASAADDARAAEKAGRCEGLVATRWRD